MLYDLVRPVVHVVRLRLERKFDVPNICMLGLVMLSLMWILWRFWSFTLLPYFRTEEPKDLPYWIPCKVIPKF